MKFVLRLAALVAVLAILFLTLRNTSDLNRVNILVGTSPVSVWSLNKEDKTFSVVLLSADVAADSREYGRYSLESLWKLGFIDAIGGSALAKSLTDALALPIPWFIGEGDTLIKTSDIQTYGKSMFSWRGFIPFVLGQRKTNVPLGTWLSFSWALSRMPSDGFTQIDLVSQPPTAQETIADGTIRQFLDQQRLDVLLKGRFEDESIRAEGITVAVYNTTSTPALGTYVARMMTQEGVLVVAVGNGDQKIEGCVIEGKKEILKSHTARVIKELFTCRETETEGEERADLVVLLGR